MADRITVLDKGKLEQVDLTNEIFFPEFDSCK